VILPVLYAVLVWYFAMRWRRRWPAFLAVGLGVANLLVLGAMVHAWDRTRAPWPISELGLLFSLLYPYTALVGVIGVYISLLPRAAKAHECRKCRYDLSGLEPDELVCPECGTRWTARGARDQTPRVPIPSGPPKGRTPL
jgi:hypothetical protein